MGAASSFGPDVAFVVRTMTLGIIRELREVLRGDKHGIRRIAAIVVGVTCAGVGNVVGRGAAMRRK